MFSEWEYINIVYDYLFKIFCNCIENLVVWYDEVKKYMNKVIIKIRYSVYVWFNYNEVFVL